MTRLLPPLAPRLHPWTLIFGCVLAYSFIACAGDPPPPPPDVYTSRGMVRQLPSEGPARTELYIHHETIEDFKDEDGKVVGMEAMAMPFAVAETADLSGLNAGDKVSFTFEVRWQDGDPLKVTAIEGLGPDVRLDFEMAEDESGDTSEGDASDPGSDHESHHTPASDDTTGHDHGSH